MINHEFRGPGGKHTLKCVKAANGLWCKPLIPKSEDTEAAHVVNANYERRRSALQRACK